MPSPFLTIYTPTFRRPEGLRRCLASVARQTVVETIQHLVVPDHIGIGIAGMYAKAHDIAGAIQGAYVHLLGDDDQLATPSVVEELREFIALSPVSAESVLPPVVIVKSQKGTAIWPDRFHWPPQCGRIDLGCLVVRTDVWRAHRYGHRYEGDFDFAHAIAASGHQATFCDLLFMRGQVSHGEPEA